MPFEISETRDPDGGVRLALNGELDMAAVESLNERLADLKEARANVHLDISALTFLDSSGLRALTTAVGDARRDGWQLEVGIAVSRSVRRLIDLLGAAPRLWPPDGVSS